jgi:hypothetical protein
MLDFTDKEKVLLRAVLDRARDDVWECSSVETVFPNEEAMEEAGLKETDVTGCIELIDGILEKVNA